MYITGHMFYTLAPLAPAAGLDEWAAGGPSYHGQVRSDSGRRPGYTLSSSYIWNTAVYSIRHGPPAANSKRVMFQLLLCTHFNYSTLTL